MLLSGQALSFWKMPDSCSFRITRTAEDLAQTLAALSQRLVKLEQRQEALEMRLRDQSPEIPLEEIEVLDGVEQLLKECKELLDSSPQADDKTQTRTQKTPT